MALARPQSAAAARPQSASGSRPQSRSGTELWKGAGDAVRAVSRIRTTPTAAIVPVPGSLLITAAGGSLAEGSQLTARGKASSDRRVAVLAPTDAAARTAAAAEARQLALCGSACAHAAKKGDSATLHMLIQRGPKGAHDWTDENTVAPLHMAASYGHMACAEIICNAGVVLDRPNCWGSTALINAAHNAHSGVVKLLILNGASVALRDKDGTALDNALLRIRSAVRGIDVATDKDHADKKVLESTKDALNKLARNASRGPPFFTALTAAIEPLKLMLEAAIAAAAEDDIAPPQVKPLDKSEAKGKGGKDGKKEDAPEAPKPGRVAAYKGCLNFIQIIEMLRDPGAVRKAETLASGNDLFSKGKESTEAAQLDGLTQRVGRIRSALALDGGLSLPDAIQAANRAMGLETEGSLPEQVQRLVVALGVQYP